MRQFTIRAWAGTLLWWSELALRGVSMEVSPGPPDSHMTAPSVRRLRVHAFAHIACIAYGVKIGQLPTFRK